MPMQEVHFTIAAPYGEKQMLADARYLPNNTPKPVVLFVHGFKGFKDWGTWHLVANAFAEAGFVFVKANLSHNGTTPEHPTDFADLEAFGHNNFTIELDDIGAMIDRLCGPDSPLPATEADTNHLYLVGHSRGGGLVLLKAYEDNRIKAVTTLASVSDFSNRYPEETLEYWRQQGVIYIPNSRTGQEMPLYYQFVEDYLRDPDRFDIPTAANQLTIPLFVVHGTDDPTVPVYAAHELKQQQPRARLLIIEGADHTFGSKHPAQGDTLPPHTLQATEATIAFFKELGS